jgi:hypothetical protein
MCSHEDSQIGKLNKEWKQRIVEKGYGEWVVITNQENNVVAAFSWK